MGPSLEHHWPITINAVTCLNPVMNTITASSDRITGVTIFSDADSVFKSSLRISDPITTSTYCWQLTWIYSDDSESDVARIASEHSGHHKSASWAPNVNSCHAVSKLTEPPYLPTSTAPPSPQLTSESNDILANESHPQRTVIDATHAMPSRHPYLVDQTSLSSTPSTESPVQTVTRGRPRDAAPRESAAPGLPL